jgi:hypothetical protein
MIDEIPIIGVTEWTVDGLAAKEFRRRAGSPGTVWTEYRRAGWGREEWGTGARQPNSFDFEPPAILD